MTKDPMRSAKNDSRKSRLNKIGRIVGNVAQRFPMVRDCRLEVCRLIVDAAIVRCDECNGDKFDRLATETTMTCQRCGAKRLCTKGTPMYKMKAPRAWLIAVELLKEGIPISGAHLGRLGGVSSSAGREIMLKLATALKAEMTDEMPIRSAVLIPVVNRRSRLTPAQKHPRHEEDVCEQQVQPGPTEAVLHTQADDGTNDIEPPQSIAVDAGEMTPQAALVYEALATETHFDILCRAASLSIGELSVALLELELAELIELLPGNRFRRKTKDKMSQFALDLSDDAIEAALNVIEFVREIYGGISRKCAQLYAALHWWYQNPEPRRRNILAVCLHAGYTSARELLEYTSPPCIQIAKP